MNLLVDFPLSNKTVRGTAIGYTMGPDMFGYAFIWHGDQIYAVEITLIKVVGPAPTGVQFVREAAD